MYCLTDCDGLSSWGTQGKRWLVVKGLWLQCRKRFRLVSIKKKKLYTWPSQDYMIAFIALAAITVAARLIHHSNKKAYVAN